MRIASKGNWNIVGMDKETEKVIYPFYDGFNTKNEAINMCNALSNMDSTRTYIVIKNK